MKKLTLFTLLLSTCLLVQAQVVPRNILIQKYPQDQVKQALVPYGQYKPYPTTAAGWKAAVPDSVLQALVQAGEKQLGLRFPTHLSHHFDGFCPLGRPRAAQ